MTSINTGVGLLVDHTCFSKSLSFKRGNSLIIVDQMLQVWWHAIFYRHWRSLICNVNLASGQQGSEQISFIRCALDRNLTGQGCWVFHHHTCAFLSLLKVWSFSTDSELQVALLEVFLGLTHGRLDALFAEVALPHVFLSRISVRIYHLSCLTSLHQIAPKKIFIFTLYSVNLFGAFCVFFFVFFLTGQSIVLGWYLS